MNQHVAIFSRIAEGIIKKALSPQNMAKSQDRAQMLINNMNLINETLTAAAIKLINKARRRDIDCEELTLNLRDIIQITVVSYARRAC